MSDPQRLDIRIGDAEREDALRALGEHLSAGRLDVDEYGERTAKVATARTRGEVTSLFGDLPEPRPHFGVPAAQAPAPAGWPQNVPAAEEHPAVQRWEQRPLAQRIGGAVMGVSWILMIPLYFATHTWFVFLLPIVLSVVLGAVWGKDWDDDRKAVRRAQREQRRRDRGR